MAEEFNESELFDQNSDIQVSDHHPNFNSREFKNKINNWSERKKSNNKKRNSVPVNIPKNAAWIQYVESESESESDIFEDEYKESGEIVPPHVITGRRIAGKMAFSVCTGNGRTLKGRDLSQVRNSILKMTGFLEA